MVNGEDNRIQTADNEGGDNFLNSLVALSVKTLFYLLLIIAVSVAAVSQIFPFATMRFYSDFEDYETAVKYAKTEAERGGKNYFETLFEGIKMSEALLYNACDNDGSKYAAEYLLYFTQKMSDLENFDVRCAALDQYYSDNATSIVAKAGLYSFKDYIFSSNTAARSVLSKADKLLYDGNYTQLAETGFITQDELSKMFRDIIYGNYIPSTAAELAILFNQISENIIWGDGSLIFDYDKNETTPMYDLMLLLIQNAEGYSYINQVLSLNKSIQRLYLLRAAATLGENIKVLFDSLTDLEGKEEKIDEVQEVFSVLRGDEQVPLYDYYRTELSAL